MIAKSYPPNRSTASRRPHGLAHGLLKFGHSVTLMSEKIKKNDSRYDSSFKPTTHKKLKLKLKFREQSLINSWIWFILDLLNPIKRPRKQFYAWNNIDMSKDKYDVIWATFPDYCSLAMASKLSNKLNIPWVADFRDCFQTKHTLIQKILLPIRKRVLKNLISSASLIISVASIVSEQIKKINTNKPIILIENAFDKKDFLSRPIYKTKRNKINFVFTGTIKTYDQSLLPLLNGLLRNKKFDNFKIKIDLFGNISKTFIKECRKHKLNKLVKFHGIVNRKIALKHSMRADILLSSHLMNSKIYDYIGAQRLILMIKSDFGDAEKHILRNRIGWAPRNEIEMDKAINEIFEMSRNKKIPPIKPNISKKFEYHNRSIQLNRVLANVVKKYSKKD